MFIVSVPAMAASYLRCPQVAVSDLRTLIAGVWKHLETDYSEKTQTLQNVKSLSSVIVEMNGQIDAGSNALAGLNGSCELDFVQLCEMSPVDSIRRFREAIECCRDLEPSLFSSIELPHLDGLLKQLLNRVSDDEYSIRETIRRVEFNLNRFSNAAMVSRLMSLTVEDRADVERLSDEVSIHGRHDVGVEIFVLTDSDPDASNYRQDRKWCTAAWAEQRYGIKKNQLTRASTNIDGITVDRKTKVKIKVTRKLAQVGGGKKGQLFVYHAGDLMRLADALNVEE